MHDDPLSVLRELLAVIDTYDPLMFADQDRMAFDRARAVLAALDRAPAEEVRTELEWGVWWADQDITGPQFKPRDFPSEAAAREFIRVQEYDPPVGVCRYVDGKWAPVEAPAKDGEVETDGEA